MKKIFKWVGILIGVLILVTMLAVLCLVIFVNPNTLKPLITEKVMNVTGRQLTIDGDLAWTVFPYFGVKTGHMLLSNPSGFQQKIFAEVEHATVGVKLIPLLHKQIESSGISLDGMKLYLIKNAEGNTNWSFPAKSSAEQPMKTEPALRDTLGTPPILIGISGINITHTEIMWIDEQKNQNIRIGQFELQAKNISVLNPFSITSEFDFVSNVPAVSGHIKWSSQAAINLAKQIFSFRDLDINTETLQNQKKLNLKVTGDVIVDLQQQTLQWTRFQGIIANLILNGKLNITDLTTHPNATGQLHVSPFDMKKWLQDIGHDISNIKVLKEVSGDIDILSSSKSMSLRGQFKIDEMKIDNVKITHLRIPMQYQNGLLEFSPVSGSFYQGVLQATKKVDLKDAIPEVFLEAKLINFSAESLMQDIAPHQKLKLSGEGNADLQANTLIGDGNASLKNLNGTGHFSFNKGVLQGIDIAYLINRASAFIDKETLSSSNTDQTNFGNLTGSFVIRNGIVSNNDLLVNSAEFTTKGRGNINLVNQTMDYHLQTLKTNTAATNNSVLNVFPIPILVSGNLKNPKIGLDVEALAKAIAQQQWKSVQVDVEDKLKTKVPEKARDLLKNLLGH